MAGNAGRGSALLFPLLVALLALFALTAPARADPLLDKLRADAARCLLYTSRCV